MINYPQMKLGRLPRKPEEKSLKLSKYLVEEALPSMPASYYYSKNISNWGMMLNDNIGDCTIAGAGHGIMNVTNSNGRLFTPTDADILGAYSAVSGYVNGDPSTDNGATCISVLDYFQNTGIAGHKISGHVEINMKLAREVQYGVYLFGYLYIGVQLPLITQGQQDAWYCEGWPVGDAAPGSWGGHCVIIVGYDSHGLDVITWGQRIRMSWNYWYTYVDEAHVTLSPDFFTNGVAPNGIDLATLQNDILTF